MLRENNDSLVATLEAFVHDPLISWRLLNTDRLVVQSLGRDVVIAVDFDAFSLAANYLVVSVLLCLFVWLVVSVLLCLFVWLVGWMVGGVFGGVFSLWCLSANICVLHFCLPQQYSLSVLHHYLSQIHLYTH